MRALFALTAALVMASAMSAVAQQSPNTQQERMKSCNAQAGSANLTGDARKSFMSDCLAGKTGGSGSTAGLTQQEKMKACNTQANAQKLAGDTRKSFMSSCLSSR